MAVLVVIRVVNPEVLVVAALEAEVVEALILAVKAIQEDPVNPAAAIIWVAVAVVSVHLAIQVDKDAVVKGILFLLVFKQIPLLVLLIV